MIRNESFVKIGKMFGVTDNAIKKWCKSYNLPSTKKEIQTFSNESWSKIWVQISYETPQAGGAGSNPVSRSK